MSGVRAVTGLKTFARISIRRAVGLKAVAGGHIRNGSNILKDFAGIGGIAVVVSPDYAVGFANSRSAVRISTGSVTATITGADNVTYSWSSGTVFAPTNPTARVTAFRTIDPVGSGDSVEETSACTVTDTHGNTAVSGDVSLSASNFGI